MYSDHESASQGHPEPLPGSVYFIWNLPGNLSPQELYAAIEGVVPNSLLGVVVPHELPEDDEPGDPLGIAFVTFHNPTLAALAADSIKEVHGQEMQLVPVDVASDRSMCTAPLDNNDGILSGMQAMHAPYTGMHTEAVAAALSHEDQVAWQAAQAHATAIQTHEHPPTALPSQHVTSASQSAQQMIQLALDTARAALQEDDVPEPRLGDRGMQPPATPQAALLSVQKGPEAAVQLASHDAGQEGQDAAALQLGQQAVPAAVQATVTTQSAGQEVEASAAQQTDMLIAAARDDGGWAAKAQHLHRLVQERGTAALLQELLPVHAYTTDTGAGAAMEAGAAQLPAPARHQPTAPPHAASPHTTATPAASKHWQPLAALPSASASGQHRVASRAVAAAAAAATPAATPAREPSWQLTQEQLPQQDSGALPDRSTGGGTTDKLESALQQAAASSRCGGGIAAAVAAARVRVNGVGGSTPSPATPQRPATTANDRLVEGLGLLATTMAHCPQVIRMYRFMSSGADGKVALKTPVQLLQEFTTKRGHTLLTAENAGSPNGPFTAHYKLVEGHGQGGTLLATASATASSKKSAKMDAAALTLEELLEVLPTEVVAEIARSCLIVAPAAAVERSVSTVDAGHPRCRQFMAKFPNRTCVAIVHEYAQQIGRTAAFTECQNPAGFCFHASVVGTSPELTTSVTGPAARSKQEAKQLAAADLLEKLLEGA